MSDHQGLRARFRSGHGIKVGRAITISLTTSVNTLDLPRADTNVMKGLGLRAGLSSALSLRCRLVVGGELRLRDLLELSNRRRVDW